MLCSLPGLRGTPGAGVGHGWYPCEPVSRPHDCCIHEAGKSAPPSSGAPSPSVEG